MRDYAKLNPRTELEQYLARDLKTAFEKRDFKIKHNGGASNASGGFPDIEMWDENYHFTIEVTQTTKSSADREYPSITDHLKNIKNKTNKKCFCIYVSPETSIRMIDNIYLFNNSNENELKILPLNFENMNLILDKFSENVVDVFPTSDFINVFNRYLDFSDDQRIKKILFEEIFSTDKKLGEQITKEEEEKDQETLELLIKDLKNLERYLREQGIATTNKAIDTLIYLVFIKLYEEKREKRGEKNRFKLENFEEYKKNLKRSERESNKAIHILFNTIKEEAEFDKTKMFQDNDNFEDTLYDNFITDKVFPIFEKYPRFIDTKIDVLGAVYEVLALRAEKDVKIGQFFTPEKVVDFIVKLADLSYKDIILDPACGTGRFLIYAMKNMEEKLNSSEERNKGELLKNIHSSQLFGSDIDSRIAKIAKMNMWIHGDGKSNIYKHNGLTLNKVDENLFNKGIDVILTNPPLGDLNYQENYDDDFKENNAILPRKNLTKKKKKKQKQNLENHKKEEKELREAINILEENKDIKTVIEFVCNKLTQEQKNTLKNLKNKKEVKHYKTLIRKIRGKERTIKNNEEKLKDIEALIRTNQCEYEITGTNMKGGALFLSLKQYSSYWEM